MEHILNKSHVIGSNYKVKFFIDGNDYFEKYRVIDENGDTYLLKIYNSSKLSRHSLLENSLLEKEVLSQVKSKGIINLTGSGEFTENRQKFHYLVFDFISGETLLDKLERDGPFSIYSAIPIVISILNVLSILHGSENTIIHNNISMKSITLDYSNSAETPVLTNFEYARYLASENNSIYLKELSPFYIAPELYNGISTPQSDIFSVGALLYHMIMGIPPWYIELPDFQHSDEKIKDAIHDNRSKQLNYGLDGFNDDIDDHIKDTINKALAINVDLRFKSADDFIGALKREVMIEHITEKKIPNKKHVIKKGQGFSAIAGMNDLKERLDNDVIRALNEKELYESYGVTIPNGMLLYGPPGCGKTFISERFAEEVGFNFMQLNPSDIKSKYINATEEKIGEIFKEAEKNAPTIIFIDEIDAVVPNREGDLHHMNASSVNEFLAQMSNCSEKGIFVIAASNRPEKIDPAILRTGRIDRTIYLPPPDKDARSLMFKLYLEKRPVDLGVNYDVLADLTENYVASDIKYLIDEASRFALKTKERITQVILEKVISDTQPSVSYSELSKYKALKENFENKKKDNTGTNKIGFI